MTRYFASTARLLFLFSALWSIGAGVYIFFTPLTIQGVTLAGSAEGSRTVEAFTQQTSWYEIQGLWGVIVLIIFAALYCLTAFLAWRGWTIALILFTSLTLTLTFLAGFSIGPFYLPAAVASLLGALLLIPFRQFARLSDSIP